MKVNIGPYRNDLIPVRSWERNYEMWRSDEFYLDEKDYTWYDKIVMGAFDKLEKALRPINHWSNSRKRRIKIHVDNYDVWSMDHTLAMIVLPMLKKLKEVKQGSPNVDNEDVPEHLRAPEHNLMDPNTQVWGTDDLFHERWAWVLDEMIWTFEQHAADDDSSQFHYNSDNMELKFTPIEGKKGSTLDIVPKDPSKPKHFYDREAHMKHNERKANGRRLFAKYYEGLWD